jgi:succinyldiaminopimelate transaminase
MPAPINPRLARLDDYPFRRLDRLLDGLSPVPDRPIVMSIGEPRHLPPPIVAETLQRHAGEWGRYPPTRGTDALRTACAEWLIRRYRLPEAMIDPDRHVLPVGGTREGLFAVALAAMPETRGGRAPLVLMPDPFYQVYRGAAVVAGAEPVFLPCTRAGGFLPDLDAIPDRVWERTALFYLCSPANPQGAVADRQYLARLIARVRSAGALLVMDECYAEIYSEVPPVGVMETVRDLGGDLANVVSFHSLSKRSSVPGLRSGFVVGDAEFLEAFLRMRTYGGGQQPLPVQAAAAELWRDDAHVEENRALYRRKFEAAADILRGRFGFFVPAGGFFLWLDVGDGEQAARNLWSTAGVKVMPGGYLASGEGEAARHIRVALVPPVDVVRTGLGRLAEVLA